MGKNVTWNATIPHSAFVLNYDNFSKACPIEGGILRCDREGSYHFSDPEAVSTTLRIPFQGSAMVRSHLALWFVVSFSCAKILTSNLKLSQYSTEIIGRITGVVPGKPEGTLLARHENLPRSYSYRILKLTTSRFETFGSLNFTHAIVYVDTYAVEGNAEVTTYLPDIENVKLTSGWNRNGSYWQASNTSDQVVQFDFEGNGMLTYGMCTNTNDMYAPSLGDIPEVDGRTALKGSLYSPAMIPYAVEDCLIQWELWLDSGKHNFTWHTRRDQVMISRFEVVNFPSPPAPGAGRGGSLSTGGIIGITFAMIILLTSVFGIVFCIRRNNKRNTLAMAVEDVHGKNNVPQSPDSHLSPQSVSVAAFAPSTVSTSFVPEFPVIANAAASYNVTPVLVPQHNQPPLPAGNPTSYSSYNPYSSHLPMSRGIQDDPERPVDLQGAGSSAAPVPPGGASKSKPLPTPGPPPVGAYPLTTK